MYDEPMNDNIANGLGTIANAFCFAENSDILTLDCLVRGELFIGGELFIVGCTYIN